MIRYYLIKARRQKEAAATVGDSFIKATKWKTYKKTFTIHLIYIFKAPCINMYFLCMYAQI